MRATPRRIETLFADDLRYREKNAIHWIPLKSNAPQSAAIMLPRLLIFALLCAQILSAQTPTADLVLVRGHILTMDARDSVARAVAIRDGIIVKVGSDAEILEFAGKAPGLRV